MLGGPRTSFLLPAPTEPGGYLRVMALGMPQDAPRHLSLVVVLSPCEDLHGLAHRELEVLGLLIACQRHRTFHRTRGELFAEPDDQRGLRRIVLARWRVPSSPVRMTRRTMGIAVWLAEAAMRRAAAR